MKIATRHTQHMKNFLSTERLAEAPTRHAPLGRGAKIVAHRQWAHSTEPTKRISSRMSTASQIMAGIKLAQEACPSTEIE